MNDIFTIAPPDIVFYFIIIFFSAVIVFLLAYFSTFKDGSDLYRLIISAIAFFIFWVFTLRYFFLWFNHDFLYEKYQKDEINKVYGIVKDIKFHSSYATIYYESAKFRVNLETGFCFPKTNNQAKYMNNFLKKAHRLSYASFSASGSSSSAYCIVKVEE